MPVRWMFYLSVSSTIWTQYGYAVAADFEDTAVGGLHVVLRTLITLGAWACAMAGVHYIGDEWNAEAEA